MTMKARVKNSGKIVEVKEWRGASDVVYSTLDMNTFYQASDLDFNLDLPQPEATISGWACRDKDGTLCLYYNKPMRGKEAWFGIYDRILPKVSFPSLTWQDEPIEVEITIKPKKQ